MTEATISREDGPMAGSPVRGHRRGVDWHQVTYAVHRATTDPATSVEYPPLWSAEDLGGWQLLMTAGGCFTGLTALEQWGVSLPPVPDDCPIFLALGKNDPRPMRAGVHTSRHIRPVEFVDRRGLRIAVPAEAIVAAARWLSLLDLVAVLDSALHLGIVEIDELVTISRSRRPGATALRRALPLVDAAAESLPETLLRILHVSCGVEVETQWVLADEHGVEIARADLWLKGTRSIHEYDGAEHEKAHRRVKDLQRSRRIDRAGHVRRGYTLGDLLHRGVTVLDDIDRAVGRTHDPRRLQPWLELVRQSLYTPSGRSAFLARIPSCPPRRRSSGA